MQWTLTRYRGSYVDNARSLNINRMIECGVIKPSTWATGSWVWTDRETGEQTAGISYECNTVNKDDSYLRIYYTITREQKKIDYKIQLSRTKQKFGGERFWFICPYTGRRVSKLYLPSGGDTFASRHAYNLKYGSQSEAWHDRALRKKWKLLSKFDDRLDLPLRPKGMHQKTYKRLLDQYCKQEDICDNYLMQIMERHGFKF